MPTVLITGANRGIGLELARQYGAECWSVIGTARQPDKAESLQGTGVRFFRSGGANAAITPEQSVSGMRKIVDGLSLPDSGCFLSRDGRRYPW